MKLKQWMKEKLKIFLIVIFSIVLSCIGVEFFLRKINYPSHACKEIDKPEETDFGQFDPLLGWSYIPYQQGNADYEKTYVFAREGFRSANKEDVSDPTKPKVLIIGDSILFGHGLSYEETIGAKLQKKLPDYQVLNFAVQGYGTDQMYLLSQKLIEQYKPKVIISDYIYDHDSRNLNEDRRDFFACTEYSGTKPRFELNDKKLQQVYYPQQYQDYDRLKIAVLFRKLWQQKIKKKADGDALSGTLLKKIHESAKSHDSLFYVIGFEGYSPYTFTDGGSVTFITLDNPEDPHKYHINPQDAHPNSDGTNKIVNEFVEVLKKDGLIEEKTATEEASTPL